ncbi:AraC family transcriptional regulator [Terrimonas sp.]|uniref:helix-turn-helix domain-containing protein n=1 Tax=Terrimonas sp. TaxID=1914338 RepID=UPI000D51AD1B|nr:helix-turn-helix transcriptional regulator [Terrimonas sp.]PVD52982.1 AraC family transcriptional regulator [Terrimonas sp.]
MENREKKITRKDEILLAFLSLMEKHFDDLLKGKVLKLYRIRDFAAYLHIHPTHFSDTIKKACGRSPWNIYEERIISEAKKMLQNTSLSISDISYNLSFDDPSNFTKFFKMREGCTPSSYRKRKCAEINDEMPQTVFTEGSQLYFYPQNAWISMPAAKLFTGILRSPEPDCI